MKDMSKAWYLIYTKPGKERLVKDNLKVGNMETFYPTIEEFVSRKGELVPSIKPFFPRYVFGHFSLMSDYYRVKWMPGVNKIISFGELPIPIDDQVVDFLRSYANKECLIMRRGLKRGERVKIKSGPFKGLIGIIENDAPPLSRVKVLLDIIEYQGTLELPEQLCEIDG